MGAFSNQKNNNYSKNTSNNSQPAKQKAEGEKHEWAATLNMQEGEGEENKLKRITGLNQYTSKSGKTYLSGRAQDGTRYIIFFNDKA